MAAHSAVAGMLHVDGNVVRALRAGTALPDTKLDALLVLTRKIVAGRGHLTGGDLSAFFDAGYTEANFQEVILGIGLKTMSNYHNHVADPPLDVQFKPTQWTKPV